MEIKIKKQKIGNNDEEINITYNLTDEEKEKFNKYNVPVIIMNRDLIEFLKEVKHINIDNSQDYHPEHIMSFGGCGGTARLQQDYNIKQYLNQEFVSFFVEKKMKELQKAINSSYKKTFSAKVDLVSINENIEEENNNNDNIQFTEKNFLITDGAVFEIKAVKTSMKGIEDIKNAIYSTIKNIYNARVKAIETAYKEEIQQLREKIEEERSKAFIQGLKLYDEIKDNWKIEEGYLVYKHDIIATRVKQNDKIYSLNTDKFFISGLKIKIKERIYNEDTLYEDAYHPNAGEVHVCIGDLEGKDLLTVIQKIVEELKIINMNSAFSNSAEADLDNNWDEYVEEEVQELWTA